ncbi:hypothetical protein C357_14122, partial [Citreicella sp. 357]
MMRMHINGSDPGMLRLFHLDLPPEAIERFATQAGTGEYPLKYALGATHLRPAFVDVVNIRDLEGMPLSEYLVSAYQVTGDDFRQMQPQIDALKGHVVALSAQAFDHVSQDLAIAAPLRWVGTFPEEQARPRGPDPRSAPAQLARPR